MSKRSTDIIPKDATPIDLRRIIAGQQQIIAELRIQLRKEIHAANSDPLTGCFNRRGLQKMYETLFNSSGGIVLAIDMRRLKEVNDNYGHEAGDAAIKTFASKLSQLIRKEDILARTGGDEFVLILTDTTPQDSAKKRMEIKEKLGNLDFDYNEQTLQVGVRFGAARYNSKITIEQALTTADHREGQIRDNLRRFEKPRYA